MSGINLILFLGSGVSKASGLPLTPDLTDAILGGQATDRPLGASDLTERIQGLLRIMKDVDTRDAKRTKAAFRGRFTSYEDLFFLCEEMTTWNIGLAENSIITPFMKSIERRARHLVSGRNLSERLADLGRLARDARIYIQSATAAALRGRKPSGLDLIVDLARARQIEQLNIVTLNHDTLVEQLLAENGVELTDGFGPVDGDIRWYDDRLYDIGPSRVRLYKLHGSVNSYQFAVNGLPRPALVVRDPIRDLHDNEGKSLTPWFPDPSFLTGGNKAIRYQHGIYIDLQFRFQELLRRCDLMLMCGYGWGDLAINLRLDTWMDNPLKRIVLLHPNPQEITERSMIIASAYNWWVSSGRLISVPKYMDQLSLAEIEGTLFEA